MAGTSSKALFSREMTEALAGLVRDHKDELYPSCREARFAERSKNAWKEITDELNSRFSSNVTINQVKNKVDNLKRGSKNLFQSEQK